VHVELNSAGGLLYPHTTTLACINNAQRLRPAIDMPQLSGWPGADAGTTSKSGSSRWTSQMGGPPPPSPTGCLEQAV
jgi:hypothetical protein